jgi:hypothetical protein
MFANDYVVWVSWLHSEEARVPTSRHGYDVIASFVTSGARMHPYSYLDKLQEKALY